jgi:hypothetical protein
MPRSKTGVTDELKLKTMNETDLLTPYSGWLSRAFQRLEPAEPDTRFFPDSGTEAGGEPVFFSRPWKKGEITVDGLRGFPYSPTLLFKKTEGVFRI